MDEVNDAVAEAAAQPADRRAGVARELQLESLATVFERLTAAMGTVHAEAGSVCLADQNHPARVSLAVEGHDADSRVAEIVVHRLDITERMRHTYKDERRTTDFGAAGVALLLTRLVTGLELVTQSDTGTGIDYYFGVPSNDPNNPFKSLMRLEVTGIRVESDTNRPQYRVTQKLKRLTKHQSGLPAIVAVIEFSRPLARLAESPEPRFLTAGVMGR